MAMKKIIFDCDNTFGVPDCDVDDGLALLYLLGDPQAEVLGITATYGNSTLETVYETTKQMLRELGREDIPVKKGGEKAGCYGSEASRYLAQMAAAYPGELSILATGSLTNLKGACEEDPSFFDNICEIVLMGGITEPLVFEKKVMQELNFSCDPQAAYTVLTKGKNVSVITGNNCLKVLFTKEEYKERLLLDGNPAAAYIRTKTDYWFGYNEEGYGIRGFYNWDVVAAVYLMHPELFADRFVHLDISEKDLETGYLRENRAGESVCNLQEIEEDGAFRDTIYHTWLQVPFQK